MGSSAGHGANLGASQHGVFGSLPGLAAHLHRGTRLERCGARADLPDGVFREAGPLRWAVGFDALLTIKAGEVAQGRRITEEVVAAPR